MLNAKEEFEMKSYRELQNRPHNAKCDCGESCFRDPVKHSFAQCYDCYEEATYNWVDHERGEA